jgi:hypothetical protein
MPALSILTNRTGRVIGDMIDKMQYNGNVNEEVVKSAETPGVHTEETQDKIPGVDTAQDQGPTPSETIKNDLNFAPTQDESVDPPLMETPPPVNDVPVANKAPTDDGVRRSTHVRI